MKLGLLTACLPELSLAEIVSWAAATGFEALEVAAWPGVQDRDFTTSHLDVPAMTEESAAEVMGLFAQHELQISALAYYDNNLHPDPTKRRERHDHLKACVDAAALLGCPYVGTFIGRDNGLSVLENLSEAERVLPELVDYAGERGVDLMIENCPMEGWHPDLYPANLAYSPELWEWMFDLGFYLNFDPSHLLWMGIDPVPAITPYADRVRHVQAKDTQLDPTLRNRYGTFGKVFDKRDEWDTGWWRYRVPGRGQVDWLRVIDALSIAGFDGVVSVEHEDPVFGGTVDKVKTGLEIAYDTLRPLIRTPH